MGKRVTVLSVHQPFASMMVTKHPVFASSIQECFTTKFKIEKGTDIYIQALSKWSFTEQQLLDQWPYNQYGSLLNPLPFGGIIGKVHVSDVYNAMELKRLWQKQGRYCKEELIFGQYTEDYFAWILSDSETFSHPIPVKNDVEGLWPFELPDKITLMDIKGNYIKVRPVLKSKSLMVV